MATTQQPRARGGVPRPGAPARVPFPVVDEVARHCAQDAEPNTVHIEIHLPGRVDEARLRSAFAEALARHPRALMRERPRSPFARRYEWELTGGPTRIRSPSRRPHRGRSTGPGRGRWTRPRR